MPEPEPYEPAPVAPGATATRPRRYWPCFVAGFIVAFVVIAVTVQRYYMEPSGDAITRAPLWRYYSVEIPRMFGPKVLGLVPDTTSNTLMVLLLHLACSVGSGVVGVAICWGLAKIKSQRA